MRSLFQITIFLFLLLVLLYATPSFGQYVLHLPERDKEWKRVSTEADANIDVKTSSLILESNGRIRATFRFHLAKPENAYEKPGSKYKTRFETIQFDVREDTYRIVETKLVDSRGKVVYESGLDLTRPWKEINSITGGKLYGVAVELSPLGAWSVVAARYPYSKVPSSDDHDPNAALGPNTLVSTRINKFEVGKESCSSPTYEPSVLGADEFVKWTGFSLKEAGFSTGKVEAIKIKCETSKLVSEIHVLLLASATRATLLSGGVILDLEKLQY